MLLSGRGQVYRTGSGAGKNFLKILHIMNILPPPAEAGRKSGLVGMTNRIGVRRKKNRNLM